MKTVLKFAAALAVAASAPVCSANAADITFSFNDGPTNEFYGRAHVAGTVSGTLLGLSDNMTSRPTAISIAQAPAGSR